MNWMRVFLVVAGGGVLTSLTDWLFAGDWIHRRWTYPEIWRKGSETTAIVLTSVFPFLSCAVYVVCAMRLGLHSIASLLAFSMAIWCIAPLPLILTNAAWIKMHRAFVALYALGWLVKLLIFALAVCFFLR